MTKICINHGLGILKWYNSSLYLTWFRSYRDKLVVGHTKKPKGKHEADRQPYWPSIWLLSQFFTKICGNCGLGILRWYATYWYLDWVRSYIEIVEVNIHKPLSKNGTKQQPNGLWIVCWDNVILQDIETMVWGSNMV